MSSLGLSRSMVVDSEEAGISQSSRTERYRHYVSSVWTFDTNSFDDID